MDANAVSKNWDGAFRMSGSAASTLCMAEKPMSDEEAKRELDQGDKEKIDKKLDELEVSKTSSGKDQTVKSDTEGSNSSSKNLDEQDD